MSTQDTIARAWPEHADCRAKFRQHAESDPVAGILCACGTLLGFPVEEPPEEEEEEREPTPLELSAPKSDTGKAAWEKAAAAVRSARERSTPRQDDYAAPKTGAYGTYARPVEDIPLPDEPIDAEEIEDPAELDEAQALAVNLGPSPLRYCGETVADGADYESGRECGEPVVAGTQHCASHPDYVPIEDFVEEVIADLAEPKPPEMTLWTPRDPAPKPGSGTPIMPAAESDDPVSSALRPIDPTMPYTPFDVELQMVELLRRMDNGERFLRVAISRLQAAEHAYILKHAWAINRSQARAQDQRDAEAVLACADERYEMSEAKALVSALKGTMHNIRAQLDGFRSVGRSVSEALRAPGYGR
jgi:hypothetical protein